MKLPSATKLGVTGAIALIIGQVTYWLIVKAFWLTVLLGMIGLLILSGIVPITIPLE
jgi:multisubunit Na+/H+ antiporter MnhG subunit